MMYTLVNGLLPEVMNELYTTHDQIHNHFTWQYNYVHIYKRRSYNNNNNLYSHK